MPPVKEVNRSMGAIESTFFEGYSHVPKNERLLINRKGRIIDLRSMMSLLVLKEDTAKYVYPVVNVIGQGTLHVHRLLAETFIPVDDPTGKLTVNHKDGDKTNYDLNNLEWVSRSENILHAYEHGLRGDGKAVLCRNDESNEVKRFMSVADCARHLNATATVIRNFIKSKVPYLFDNVYELVYEGDNWRGISTENMVRVKPASPAVSCLTGNTLMTFDSSESAGRYLGISESTILKQIHTHNENPYKDFRFFRRNEMTSRFEDEVYIAGSFKDVKPSTKRKPIVVEDLNTGHVTEWENATAFAKVVGINRSTIQKAIGKNDGHWHQYRFSYKDRSPQSAKVGDNFSNCWDTLKPTHHGIARKGQLKGTTV